jgi:DNA-binding NtrC family response regulator
MANILCIDDEPAVAVVLESTLIEIGHRPTLLSSIPEGIEALRREAPDLVISDCRTAKGTALDLLEFVRTEGLDIPVIVTTGYASIEHAVLMMKHGATDYLTKPLRAEALRLAVKGAIEMERLRRENVEMRRELSALRGSGVIVGEASTLRSVLEKVSAVAPTRATVLIEGESGTGKELVARAIHDQSPRADQPFVTVNCAALPEGLVESQLFGHERGAFTGAATRMLGAFERAHGGTLLLDEISEMRLDLQSKLLRAIQEQEFERVGGHQSIRVDVRILATTNRDLMREVEANRFRQDLYYRLQVVPLRMPPLKDRLEDVPLLLRYFVECSATRLGVRVPEVPDEVVAALQQRPWPGNVRELANATERAVIFSPLGVIRLESFGTAGLSLDGRDSAPEQPTPEQADFDLQVIERATIERALTATKGHRVKAARLLGISERTLRNKLNVRPAK